VGFLQVGVLVVGFEVNRTTRKEHVKQKAAEHEKQTRIEVERKERQVLNTFCDLAAMSITKTILNMHTHTSTAGYLTSTVLKYWIPPYKVLSFSTVSIDALRTILPSLLVDAIALTSASYPGSCLQKLAAENLHQYELMSSMLTRLEAVEKLVAQVYEAQQAQQRKQQGWPGFFGTRSATSAP
jgi:hypothetical protein